MTSRTVTDTRLQLFALNYYLVLYLMACKLYSPIMAGVLLLPFGLAVIPVSGVTGTLIARFGHYKWAIWLGWALSIIGLGLSILLDVHTSTVAIVFIFMCAGAGQGLLLIAHSVAVQAACKPEDAGHASSMYSFSRSFGLCLGVIVGGTIFQNFFRMRLEHLGLPAEYAGNAEGLIPVLHSMSGALATKLELQQAYAWAFRRMFATLTGVSALGLVISVLVGNHTLDILLDSKHKLRGDESREDMREKRLGDA